MLEPHSSEASDTDTIRLWTFQHAGAWAQAKARGVIRVDDDYIDPASRLPYDWMRAQMRKRLPDYRGDYPLWAWPEKPLFRYGYLPGVCVEFVVPRAAALLSNYSAWDAYVGQEMPLAISDAEYDWFQTLAAQALVDPRLQVTLRQEMEKTWERIFDLNLMQEHLDSRIYSDQLQATVAQIALEQVSSIELVLPMSSKPRRTHQGAGRTRRIISDTKPLNF